MLFAHLKRILKLDRLRLRGPNGARDEFFLAATAQNLRKLAKLIPMPSPHPQHETISGSRSGRGSNDRLIHLELFTELLQRNRPHRCRI